MKKLWMIGVGVMALSVTGAMAEGEVKQEAAAAVEKPKHERKADMPRPDLKELSVEGVVQKTEVKKKDGTTGAVYSILADDGTKVMLPKGGKDAPVVDEALVGARVKVAGTGWEMEKGGKKRVALKTVKTLERVTPAAAPAQ